jgi:hypothetical protein
MSRIVTSLITRFMWSTVSTVSTVVPSLVRRILNYTMPIMILSLVARIVSNTVTRMMLPWKPLLWPDDTLFHSSCHELFNSSYSELYLLKHDTPLIARMMSITVAGFYQP